MNDDCPETPDGTHWLEDGTLPGHPYRCFRCGEHFPDDDTADFVVAVLE